MAHPARTPIPDDQHFDLLRDFRRQSLDLYTDLLVFYSRKPWIGSVHSVGHCYLSLVIAESRAHPIQCLAYAESRGGSNID